MVSCPGEGLRVQFAAAYFDLQPFWGKEPPARHLQGEIRGAPWISTKISLSLDIARVLDYFSMVVGKGQFPSID